MSFYRFVLLVASLFVYSPVKELMMLEFSRVRQANIPVRMHDDIIDFC